MHLKEFCRGVQGKVFSDQWLNRLKSNKSFGSKPMCINVKNTSLKKLNLPELEKVSMFKRFLFFHNVNVVLAFWENCFRLNEGKKHEIELNSVWKSCHRNCVNPSESNELKHDN